MYYTFCCGNCCSLQPGVVLCVSFAQPTKTHSARQPPCVPSCILGHQGANPLSKDQQPQSTLTQASTCRLHPWRCYRAFWHGRRAHILLSPAVRLSNGRAMPSVQLLAYREPISSLFLEGRGWLSIIWAFFLAFCFGKKAGDLVASPLAAHVALTYSVCGLSTTSGPPSSACHHLPQPITLREALVQPDTTSLHQHSLQYQLPASKP